MIELQNICKSYKVARRSAGLARPSNRCSGANTRAWTRSATFPSPSATGKWSATSARTAREKAAPSKL